MAIGSCHHDSQQYYVNQWEGTPASALRSPSLCAMRGL
jgi:hypothetical protein